MKKYVYLLIMLVVLLPVLAVAGSDNPWEEKLPFKSATIEYSMSGVEKGTETLYIADYGKKTATYHSTTTTMMGITKIDKTVEFIDPDWVYTFDLQEKYGTKAVNPQKYMIEEYNNLSEADKKQVQINSKEFGSSMGAGMGGKVEKNAVKILGYDCDKVTIMGATIYNMHDSGILLKSESNMMGMTIKVEATKIDKGSVDKKVFKHPEGIEPVLDPEADAMARSMAKETMQMLKDPEATQKAANGNPAFQYPDQQDMTPEEREEMEQAMEALKGIFGN